MLKQLGKITKAEIVCLPRRGAELDVKVLIADRDRERHTREGKPF